MFFNIFFMSSWYAEEFYVFPRSQKRLDTPNDFWTYELNCYFLKADKGSKYREWEKQWKCNFSNVLLTWYKSNLWKKFKSNTKPNF